MRRLVGLIVLAMVLAMLPTASAASFSYVGYAKYPNGTEVPDGWDIWMDNVNQSYANDPWYHATEEFGYWNAHVDGTKEGDSDWIYVNLTSPDGRWFGEFSARLSDILGIWGLYIHNITVYETKAYSCDASGNEKNEFAPGETMYANVSGIPGVTYKLWIQDDPVAHGDELIAGKDPSPDGQEEVTIGANGYEIVAIWSNIPAGEQKYYDIVADSQTQPVGSGGGTAAPLGVGVYKEGPDGIDSAITYGATAPIPELATFTLIGIGLMMLVGLIRYRRT